MKGARKSQPPRVLVEWLGLENDDWAPAYPFDDPNVRNAVRDALYIEQRGLCVYCGHSLDMSLPGKTFHIEHFRPQNGPNGQPELAVEYNNLFLSCRQQGSDGSSSQTCGTLKSDWFDENEAIYPEYPICTRRFCFRLSGKIEPKVAEDIPALIMITRLGLDHPELVKDRERVLELLDNDELTVEDFWSGEKQRAESYAHVAYEHVGETLP